LLIKPIVKLQLDAPRTLVTFAEVVKRKPAKFFSARRNVKVLDIPIVEVPEFFTSLPFDPVRSGVDDLDWAADSSAVLRCSAMHCPACRHDNPAGQKFCGECGARLAPAPTATAPPSNVTSPLDPPATPGTPPSRFVSPAAYTPKHLAEKILTSKDAIQGERKQVTVMFTDVSGFTAMSERLDPEEVHGIMDRAFEIILAAVHRYEGTINQFLGDGVMALFGAPIAHEDHAHRALAAALDVQRGLEPLGEHVRRTYGREFLMRIGINTGPVVVGAIGRDLRMDYTAVGDTTNLAARLLNVAKPGQIVVSRYTQHLRDGFFQFSDLGEIELKGKTHPVRAYALMAEVRGQTRLEVSRARGLTPLMGRAAELARLQAAYRRATDGDGHALLLVGEPGQGKSRLLYEFIRELPSTEIVEASCLSYGGSIPYHPILELLRRYLGIDEAAAEPDKAERIRHRLAALGLDTTESVDLLGHFLGVAVTPGFLGRLQAVQLKERTLALLHSLFLEASRPRPLLLIVENLHWIDASSAEFLRALCSGLGGHRVLLVGTARPATPEALLPPAADTIALDGLDEAERRRMVLALLGADSASEELFQVLLSKAEGNPLYLEEIVRQLRESDGLTIVDRHAALRTVDLRVPATIHDIIAARVDRLGDTLKLALQGGAVVGRQFTVAILRRVLETDGELLVRLAELHGLDFVFPTMPEPEPAYSFKHALTQSVVYDSLLVRRRRQYHGAAAAALEELSPGGLDEVVELLAYHYARSDETEKAVDYAILAAEKAQRRWANLEALAHFEAALLQLGAMPDTLPNRRRRIDAVVKQAEVKFALGRHAEHIEALESIRPLVEEVGDPHRLAAWHCWAGFLHSLTGSPPGVPLAYCRRALDVAEDNGLAEYGAFAQCSLTHVSVVAGDLRSAVTAGTRALPVFERHGNRWWTCRTLWGLSMAFNSIGEWARSLEACRRGLALGEELRDRRLRIVGLFRTGSTHVLRGDWETGLQYCEEALALAPPAFDAAMTGAVKALGRVKSGDVTTGIADLREAVATFERFKLRYTRSVVALWLAEAQLRCGEGHAARALIEDVLTTSREVGYRHLEAMALRLRGEALVTTEPATARDHLEAALRILEEIDARNDVAKTLVARALLHRTVGEESRARDLLQHALVLFEELGTVDEPRRVRAVLESASP
jgi:class 3 adenylate cyclase/tetratricopeptide (TPR) repeat protein